MHDNEFDSLGDRLLDEAGRLLVSSPPPLAELRDRRVRQLRRQAVVGVVIGLAALLGVGLVVDSWIQVTRPQNWAQKTGDGLVEEEIRPVPKLISHGDSNVAPEDEPEFSGITVLAVLVSHVRADGEMEYLPALYVPGNSEELDSVELTPSVRRAITQVLGSEQDVVDQEIF